MCVLTPCPKNCGSSAGCSLCRVATIETYEPSLIREERHPSSARFHTILRELGALHDQKQKDYGTDKDPFANIRGSEEWGIEPWVGALVRATDKLKRLQKFARVGELANEAAEDSFRDLAVYAVIALVLYEEVNTDDEA